MTSLQIFSGLAPLALGIIGLAMAHSDLMRVRRRKAQKLLPFVEDREKQFYLWSFSIQKPNAVVGYAAVIFLVVSVCFLVGSLALIKAPRSSAQDEDKTIFRNFTDHFKQLGIGGP
ncbi:MAG TPA: hypothetical protein VGO49_17690 [Bradyrhizobium sp.]|nr:hypothetical protein [Bradyrhizobium sp.]